MAPLKRPANRGFSLIELLVALVIAMIGTLAIMQIYISGESGKRALGSLGEAQTGAFLALHQIEREIQHAGLGFINENVLGCNIRSPASLPNMDNRYLQPFSIVPAGAGATHLANLWGIPPGDNGSDMIIIAAGESGSLVQGSVLEENITHTNPIPSGSTTLPMRNAAGIQAGDFILVGEKGKDCTLTKRSSVANAVTPVTGTNGEIKYYDVIIDAPTLAAYLPGTAVAMHLGRAPRFVAYAVRNGMLTRCDFAVSDCTGHTNDPAVWVPVANDVVALVAQYGFDTTAPTGDRVIDLFCKTRVAAGGNCPGTDDGLSAAPGSDPTQPVRANDWQRVLAIRLAVVSRSGQAEKDPVSPASLKLWPDSTTAPTTTGPVWTVPDPHYRYRVAYTTVALRNVIWGGS